MQGRPAKESASRQGFFNTSLLQVAICLSVALFSATIYTNVLPQLAVAGDFPFLYAMEGHSIQSGLRILEGENPYTDPVAYGAVTHMYPPVSYFIAGAAWKFGGHSFLMPRLASAIAFVCGALLLGLYIKKVRGTLPALWTTAALLTIPAIVSDCLFYATVNSFNFLFMTSAWIAGDRLIHSGRGAALAAVLSVFAIFTKQQAIVVPVVVVSVLFWRREWRPLLIYSEIILVLSLTIAGLLHVTSDGWSTRTLLLGARHPIMSANFWDGIRELSTPYCLCLYVLAFLAIRRTTLPWFSLFLLTLALGVITRSKCGGMQHAFMPLYTIAIAYGSMALPLAIEKQAIGFNRPTAAVFTALAVSLALFLARDPIDGFNKSRESLKVHAANVRRSLDVIPKPPNRTLTFLFGESALLTQNTLNDDFEIAIEFEIGGYPVLARIAESIEKEQYGWIAMATPEALRSCKESYREVFSGETCDRLERCARAIDRHYQWLPGSLQIAVPK